MACETGAHRDIQLKDIMHEGVSVTLDTPAREALKIMLEKRITAVPVVDEDGKLEGVVTDAILLESTSPKYLKYMENLSFVTESADDWVHFMTGAADKPVRELMNKEVSCTKISHSEIEVIHKMIHDGVPSVVLVDEGKVVGVVSRLDLYAAIVGVD